MTEESFKKCDGFKMLTSPHIAFERVDRSDRFWARDSLGKKLWEFHLRAFSEKGVHMLNFTITSRKAAFFFPFNQMKAI